MFNSYRNNAENLKKSGNELYKQKKYREALEMYSEAIRLLPSCAAYYGNRSATYMMLNKFTDALEDAKQATSIDKEFTKVHCHWLLVHCHSFPSDAIVFNRIIAGEMLVYFIS